MDGFVCQPKMFVVLAALLVGSYSVTCKAEGMDSFGRAPTLATENVTRPELSVQECQQRRRVTVSAKSRNRITLKCGLAGFRLRAVQWFLPNGKAVEALLSSQPSSIGATPYGNDKLELLRNGNLRINSLDPSDSGPYLCRLRPHVKLGAEAAITCTIRDLKVTDERTPSTFVGSRVLTLGDSATLDCHTPGLLEATSRHWRKDGQVILHGRKDRRKVLSPNRKYLTFMPVRWSDAGVYRCLVINGTRKSVKRITVRVLDVKPTLAPKLLSPPVSHAVARGQSTTFDCEFKAKGLVQIKWKRCPHRIVDDPIFLPKNRRCQLVDRREYEPTDHQERTITDVKTVSQAEFQDEGFYICIATNIIGVDKGQGYLKLV